MRTTRKTQRGIHNVEDDLDDLRDGLGRVEAVAELLKLAGVHDELEPDTVEGAAGTIIREVNDLRSRVSAAIDDLKTIKNREQPAAVALEVLAGGTA